MATHQRQEVKFRSPIKSGFFSLYTRYVCLLLMVQSAASARILTNRLAYPCTKEIIQFIHSESTGTGAPGPAPWPSPDTTVTTGPTLPTPMSWPSPTESPTTDHCWENSQNPQQPYTPPPPSQPAETIYPGALPWPPPPPSPAVSQTPGSYDWPGEFHHHPRQTPPSVASPPSTQGSGSSNSPDSPTFPSPEATTNGSSTFHFDSPPVASAPPQSERSHGSETNCPDLTTPWVPAPPPPPIEDCVDRPVHSPNPNPTLPPSEEPIEPAPLPTQGPEGNTSAPPPGQERNSGNSSVDNQAPSPTRSDQAVNSTTTSPSPSPTQGEASNSSLTSSAPSPADNSKPEMVPVPGPGNSDVVTISPIPDLTQLEPAPIDEVDFDPECLACTYRCARVGRTRWGNTCCLVCSRGLDYDIQSTIPQ